MLDFLLALIIGGGLPSLPPIPSHGPLIVPIELKWGWNLVSADDPLAASLVDGLIVKLSKDGESGGWVVDNEPSIIYVDPMSLDTDWSTLFVLRHELQHVRQFLLEGRSAEWAKSHEGQQAANKTGLILTKKVTKDMRIFEKKGIE